MRDRTFRQRIGDRLLIQREQVKHWSRVKAGKETAVSDGTIRAMEQGGNAGWLYFERYAIALGLTLEGICREILLPDLALDAEGLTVEQREVLDTLDKLVAQPEERAALLHTIRAFRARATPTVDPTAIARPESAQSSGSQATAHGSRARARRSRDKN